LEALPPSFKLKNKLNNWSFFFHGDEIAINCHPIVREAMWMSPQESRGRSWRPPFPAWKLKKQVFKIFEKKMWNFFLFFKGFF
jgi:hypothetical protein